MHPHPKGRSPAKLAGFLALDVNIPRVTGEFLNSLVKRYKPKKILEIGMCNGYSTIWLAREGDKVVTIERDKKKITMAKTNFEAAGLRNIEIIEDDALKVLEKLNEEFDFVFIDATKREYLNYIKKIKVNGIVVADNVISHKDKVKEYVGYMRENYDSKLVSIGSGLEVSFL